MKMLVPLLTTATAIAAAVFAFLAWNRATEAVTGTRTQTTQRTAAWTEGVETRIERLETQKAQLERELEVATERIRTMESSTAAAGMRLARNVEQTEELRDAFEQTFGKGSNVGVSVGAGTTDPEKKVEEAEEEDEEPKLEDYVRIDLNPINGMAGPHIIFEGVNVHIESGSGRTDDFGAPFGLGNLIVGYNEQDNVPGFRSGSHNLVVGSAHSFTSTAGLIAGFANELNAPNASITGGSGNRATGWAASVTGGENNLAAGNLSSIVGGLGNAGRGNHTTGLGGTNKTQNEQLVTFFDSARFKSN